MTVTELDNEARQIRKLIIKTLVEAGSGHSAGSLDIVEILVALYYYTLNIDPQNPNDPDRDRFILSAGHLNPALYVVLAKRGFFPIKELSTLRKINSRLQGHPHNLSCPGIENSSGPLGQGISQAVGMALASKLDKKSNRIYCLISDGEHNEGQVWEALMFAAKYKLNNLTIIVDRNKIQIDGSTEDIMPLEPLVAKYRAFNYHVIEIDGHSIGHLIDALSQAQQYYDRPTIILAHTIPGKGVSFIENDYRWHGKAPTSNEAADALLELEEK